MDLQKVMYETKNSSLSELLEIYVDQQDLYEPEELDYIRDRIKDQLLNQVEDFEILKEVYEDYANSFPEELKSALCSRIEELKTKERDALLEEFLKRNNNQIPCKKCDGLNLFEEERCCYCTAPLDKSKYYDIDYLRRILGEYYVDDYVDDDGVGSVKDGSESPIILYILSFLFPLVGFILGIVFLCKDDPNKKTFGKNFIFLAILGILAAILTPVILLLAFFG